MPFNSNTMWFMMHQIHLQFIGIIACILLTSCSILPSGQSPFQKISHGIAMETMEYNTTTVGIVATLHEQISLAEEKLEELFQAKLKECESEEQRLMLMNSHRRWIEHFKNTPSRPTRYEGGSIRAIARLGEDLSRIEMRHKVMQLPMGQFQIYETIANGFSIFVNGMYLAMECGEIRLEQALDENDAENLESKHYNEFMRLLPKTCVKLQLMKKHSFYVAIICHAKDDNEGMISNEYYLCIWDENRKPLAFVLMDTKSN